MGGDRKQSEDDSIFPTSEMGMMIFILTVMEKRTERGRLETGGQYAQCQACQAEGNRQMEDGEVDRKS